MKKEIAGFCSCFLGLLLLWPTPARSQPSDFWGELYDADVVYLGEIHDSEADAAAKLEILQKLYQNNPRLAIGMEMFQRPYQKFIDDYLAGKISETELVELTEYERRWGFPWEYYAPLLRFAKANGLRVIALNAPSEAVRQVARGGWESLTTEQREWVPPLADIRTDIDDYRQMIYQVYDEMHQGHGNSESFERFFLVQVLWDETMAASIADFIATNPNYQVVVVAGQGHVMYGYGIPSRVARRRDGLVQRSLLLSPANMPERDGNNQPIADFFWDKDFHR